MEVGPPVRLSDTRNLYTVLSTKFEVPAWYQVIAPVGYGSYGFVVSAVDTRTGRLVAIKKNSRIFRDLADCKRIVREILVLRHLRHDNIIHLRDLYLPSEEPFRDVYMVSDLMDTNLYAVIRSPSQVMNETHYKYFAYQMLRGLKFLHSAGVIHRDIKPSNIVVNLNCDLQICDFGLAREFASDATMTDYVVTRYYRPPEILLMCPKYSFVVDTWSVGCIVVELMTRQTLFKGADYIQQLDLILNALRPTAEDLTFLENPQATEQVLERINALKGAWGAAPPVIAEGITDPVCRGFVMRMLVFDPRKRATPEELLAHPYLEQLHDPTDEPVAAEPFTWAHEGDELSEDLLRNEIVQVAASFELEAAELAKLPPPPAPMTTLVPSPEPSQ